MRISRPLRDWSSWPIVPSTGSAPYLRSHPVQLVCAEPYWAIVRSSLRDFALQTAVTTPGLERNAPSTELCACDPALDQQSGKAVTYVETPGRLFPGGFRFVVHGFKVGAAQNVIARIAADYVQQLGCLAVVVNCAIGAAVESR